MEKKALGLYISFIDLSTRKNIEQTPPSQRSLYFVYSPQETVNRKRPLPG
jgi:hypothetical protein